MIALCGFSASNYYNKAKLALLEKGVAFEERLVYPSVQMPAMSASPMGKVPYLLADGLSLSESQAIIEYLEEAFPQPHLYPSDPAAAAKCRELIHVIELYPELPARRLYPEAFFGGKVPDDTKRQVSTQLAKAARALEALMRFDPFAAGAGSAMRIALRMRICLWLPGPQERYLTKIPLPESPNFGVI